MDGADEADWARLLWSRGVWVLVLSAYLLIALSSPALGEVSRPPALSATLSTPFKQLLLWRQASLSASPSSSDFSTNWGDPDWTLNAISIDPNQRLVLVIAAARSGMALGQTPAVLLRPHLVLLSAQLSEQIMAAYADLAATRRRVSTQSMPFAGSRDGTAGSDEDRLSRGGAGGVMASIVRGAAISGVSADYLKTVARAESGLSPNAQASSSSGAGLYQFLAQTWLRTMLHYGPVLGLGRAASAIQLTAGGRAVVSDPLIRSRLLALRYDPTIATALAGALTREDTQALAVSLGRSPSPGELYVAHVLGPGRAAQLVRAADLVPNYPASSLFPAAAGQNPRLFFAGGEPRTADGLRALLERRSTGE